MLAQLLLKETKNKMTIMYVKDTTKNRHNDDDDDDYKLLV